MVCMVDWADGVTGYEVSVECYLSGGCPGLRGGSAGLRREGEQ